MSRKYVPIYKKFYGYRYKRYHTIPRSKLETQSICKGLKQIGYSCVLLKSPTKPNKYYLYVRKRKVRRKKR